MILVAALFVGAARAGDPPTEPLKRSLAKVTVSVGGVSKAIATGFCWSNRRYVVTSFHALRINGTYTVSWPSDPSKQVWPATPVAADKDRDLVLLELDDEAVPLPKWTALTKAHLSSTNLSYADAIHALGFYSDTPKPRPRMVIFETADSLEGNLPSDVTDELEKVGTPSITLPVFHFMSGSLLPGYSGSPMVNDRGELVAIGDGGLAEGQNDISWAIPAKHLLDLRVPSRPGTRPRIVASKSHSTRLQSASVGTPEEVRLVHYDDFEFFHKRTQTLAELMATADDPEDLASVLPGLDAADVSSFAFDIYEDLDSGLIIAAPAGYPLVVVGSEDDESLVVNYGDYTLTYDAGLGEDDEELHEFLASSDPLQMLIDLLEEESDGVLEVIEGTATCRRGEGGGLLANANFATTDDSGIMLLKVAARPDLYISAMVALEDCTKDTLTRMQEAGCGDEKLDCGSVAASSPCSKVCDWLRLMTCVRLTSLANFRSTGEGCVLPDEAEFIRDNASIASIHYIAEPNEFGAYTADLDERGLYLIDLDIVWSNGRYVETGVYRPLPSQIGWRAGLDHPSFLAETEKLGQWGLQLRDLEITWTQGGWRYAGLFQQDHRPSQFYTYGADWGQVWEAARAAHDNGWSLVDLEVPYRDGTFSIAAVYQLNSNPSAFRQGDWNTFIADTEALASQGFNLTDIETYPNGSMQWFVGVYRQDGRASTFYWNEWTAFEARTRELQLQQWNLEDMESYHGPDGVFRGLGVYRSAQ